MVKKFKAIWFIGVVLLISLSLASLSLAAPPGQAKKVNNVKQVVTQARNQVVTQARNDVPPGLLKKETTPGLANKGTPPGLVEKGGLPPGLQGRSYDQLPPGIRYNPNFREAVEKLKEQEQDVKEFSLSVTGSKFIIIPDDGNTTATYKAILANEEEESYQEVAANWCLENEKAGVSINDESGVLTVTADAVAGTITVTAAYTSGEGETAESYTDSLTVELYKQEIGEIKLAGKKFVFLKGDETDPLELEYTATVKDQKGNTMQGVSLNWSVVSQDYEDLTIEVKDGTANVEIPAKAGEFTIEAASAEVKDTLKVTVYLPVVGTVEINGNAFVALQGDEELPLVLEYTAAVMDQNGKAMEDKEIVWSAKLAAGLNFVDGKVTVTALPAAGEELTFTVKASYYVNGEVYKDAELPVSIYYPEADGINITGPAEIALPEEGETVTKEYAAAVLDQHGQEMEKAVAWFLTDTITGVSMDNGKLTVTDEAAKGKFLLWVICDNIFGNFEVSIV